MSERGRGAPRGGFQGPRGGGRGDRGGGSRGDRGGGSRGDRGGGFRGDRGGSARGGRGGRGGGPPMPDIYRPAQPSVPDISVEQRENKLIPSDPSTLDLSRLNLAGLSTPLRPGYGTTGTPIVVLTNHFRVLPDLKKTIYRYSIEVHPKLTIGRLQRQLIKLLLKDSPISSLAPGLASDFVATLITTQPLKPNQQQFDLTFRDENEDEPEPKAQRHRVQLAGAGTYRVGDLVDFLTSTKLSDAFADKGDVIQLLNIIANTTPKLRNTRETLSTRTNRHFNVTGPNATKFDLGACLEAWRGYFSSLRTSTSGLLVNVQIKHLAMFKPQRLDDAFREFAQAEGKDASKMARLLRRVRVDRLHLRKDKGSGKSKKAPHPKTIFGLASKHDGRGTANPPQVKRDGALAKEILIWMEDSPPPGVKPNSYITVFDFFNKAYGIKLADQTPVVNCGTAKAPSYLPAEVCQILPAQASLSKLSPNQTAEMIKFAVRKPYENARSITEVGLGEIGLMTSNPLLRAFGLQIDPHMIAVKARILAPPGVRYRGKQTAQIRFGAWNLANTVFSSGSKMSKWSVLWIRSSKSRDAWNKDSSALGQTLNAFTDVLKSCGIDANPPLLPGSMATVLESPDNETADEADEAEIRAGFKNLFAKHSNLDYVLVILPGTKASTYNAVKRCTDLEFGIRSSCVNGFKFAKPNNVQYFANEAMKVNLKLGGVNHTVEERKLGFISDGQTMVVGIDVTHPSPGSSEDAPSVAAMVASIDPEVGRFLAAVSIQKGREEMVTDLTAMLKTRLDLWRKHNKQQLPRNILIYRDGVSAGQYDLVLQKELPLLRKACEQVYPAKQQPAFTIAVSGKRIHTRFYPTSTDQNIMDTKSSNIKHGTVVDRFITDARSWDFYLTAHTALHGTAIPCHYFIIHDEITAKIKIPPGLKNAATVMEEITHSLCYSYQRATRPVSYAPPAYYADMVCERARCYLSALYSPNASVAGSVSGQSSAGQSGSSTFSLHPKIKDTMFFI